MNWSKQELAFPPLREKGIPPLTLTTSPETVENRSERERWRAAPPLDSTEKKTKTKKPVSGKTRGKENDPHEGDDDNV